MATTLVPGASLRNKNFLEAIQQAGSPTMYPLPAEPARFVAGKSLSNTPVDELNRRIRELCGTDPRILLTMAKMEEDDRKSWVRLAHFMILLANEQHQEVGRLVGWATTWPKLTTAVVVGVAAVLSLTLFHGQTGGAVYVRWGRKTCPDSLGTEMVYSGVAGGTWYDQSGGGTNYQCLPTDPQWGRYLDGVEEYKAYMYGAEYQLNTNVPLGSTSLHDNDVPCAVCYVPTRGSKLMIPARNTCYSGWTREYHGYLMAEHHSHPGSKEFVCVDEQPEVMPGGQANRDGALFYPVEARCGSLPCPNYEEGRELTCVVCTK
ncbi:PREDICTED: short-chain collagen C4-like [Branchiostoma belcheri]|uniref:Short-chain collagen C4-like n=1 Tax=Branchiostoma belcheri TaxID=7741 RepID=A0A6P4Z5Z9_BRABE|nr:PREDICTED: short-chain collagen C4-like [Branchiostoma belcheri]